MPLLTPKTRNTPSVDTAVALTDCAALIAHAIASADIEVPEYHQLSARLRDLQPREATLEQRRGELVVGLSRQAATEDLDARARRLIEDDLIPKGDRDRDLVLKNIQTIVDELRVVRAAIRLQEAARDQAHVRWSAAVCRILAPLHRRQVQAMAAALEKLSDTLVAHGDATDALQAAGVMYMDPVQPMPLAGETLRLDRDWSNATLWMRAAREAGLLDD